MISLTENMSDEQAWEVLMSANKARAMVIHNHVEGKEGYIDIPFDHFF